MPNKYSKDHDDDDDYSEIDESVAESVGIDEASDYEDDDESVVEEFSDYDDDDYDEEEVVVDRRGGGGGGKGGRGDRGPPPPAKGAPRRQLPRRAKSFDGDTRFGGMRGGAQERSFRGSSRSGGDRPSGSSHSRRMPPRSNTFDYSTQSSSRSLGGPKMRRDSATKIDKEAIASNRARRLRAMGGGGPGGEKVKLLSRSQSFTNRSSKSSEVTDDGEGGKDKEKSRGTRKPLQRQKSGLSELPPEEQQYARTAARGVTRSKSLKAERPNLDKASKNVANRLQAMGSTDSGARKSGSSSRYQTKSNDKAAADAASDKVAPKPVGLQW